jgi:Fe2+ or Zn2+ uptake regulation protein
MTNPTDLKNIGLKATLPRLKILEIFQQSPVRHLTAEDVTATCSTSSWTSGSPPFTAC